MGPLGLDLKPMTGLTETGEVGWWSAAPPLSLAVQCEGQAHAICWADGLVGLADHPDVDAELAMVALGGAEPACVAHYRLWNDAVSDGGFLAEWVDDTRLSQAWFSWLAMALERMRSEGFHEFLRRLPPKRAQRMGEFLHHFPPPWIDRAAATVSYQIHDGGGVACDLASGLLADAITQRLRRSFVDAVGGRQLAVGTAALVPLSLSIGPQPSATGVLIGQSRGVDLKVPPRWLHQVWASGAAVIDGHLVLELNVSPERVDGAKAAGDAVVVMWDGSKKPVLRRQSVRYVENWSGYGDGKDDDVVLV